MSFIVKVNDHRINPLVKAKVDEEIMNAKSNFRIKEKLDFQGFAEDLIPTGKQLSNKRTYLFKMLLGELGKNTEGGFCQWIKDNEVKFEGFGDNNLELKKEFPNRVFEEK